MTKPAINIQDGYLFQILKSGQPLTIELVNGRLNDGVLLRRTQSRLTPNPIDRGFSEG